MRETMMRSLYKYYAVAALLSLLLKLVVCGCSGGTYTEYDYDNLGITTKMCSSLKDETSCEAQYGCHWVDRDPAKGYCAGGTYTKCWYGECWTAYCSEEKYESYCESADWNCYWVGGTGSSSTGVSDSGSSCNAGKAIGWTILALVLVGGAISGVFMYRRRSMHRDAPSRVNAQPTEVPNKDPPATLSSGVVPAATIEKSCTKSADVEANEAFSSKMTKINPDGSSVIVMTGKGYKKIVTEAADGSKTVEIIKSGSDKD